MIRSQVYLTKKPRKLNTAILGFPGIGLIGQTVVRFLVKVLKAEKIGEIVVPSFPHQAMMLKSGMLRLVKVSIYRHKQLLFVLGDVQPMDSPGQYELAYTLVELFQKLKIKEIITIGGYATGTNVSEIYIVGNNKNILKEYSQYGQLGKAKGAIVGIAGLVPSIAKYYKIPAVVLLRTTLGNFVDVAAAKDILDVLNKRYNLKLDLSELDEKIKKTKELIKKIESEVQTAEKEKTTSYIR